MRVARHWVRGSAETTDARGTTHRGDAWGWSETSAAEALARAQSSALRVATWFANGHKGPEPNDSWQYAYLLDRPPREEIIQELPGTDGRVAGLITRNSYGSLVLSTSEVMFVDVDFPRPTPQKVGLFQRLLGRTPPPTPDHEGETLRRVQAWCEAHAEHGLRLYRTAAGLRVAVVGRPVAPRSVESRSILQQLGSDPDYQRLCEVQECYRARLTPKPWRMGEESLERPEIRYPTATEADANFLRQWQSEYEQAAVNFATCRLVETYGPNDVHEELAPLVLLHDGLTGIDKQLSLA